MTGVEHCASARDVSRDWTESRIKERIASALVRRAQAEADEIHVAVEGGKVTLRGRVGSWRAKEAAEQAAWSTPRVTCVENDILVTPP